MIGLLAVHAVVAGLTPLLGRRLGRYALAAAAVAPAATLGWLAAVGGDIVAGEPWVSDFRWVAGLELSVRFLVDGLSVVFLGLIAGIGVLILVYATYYLHDEHDAGRLAGLLVAFAAAMTGLVTADNLLLLYVFWELTSVTSYLLIGIDDAKEPARRAARQALVVTAAGGLAMLAGLVLLAQEAGTYQLSAVVADPPVGGLVPVALLLILAGALTKSAQVPFHFWLPGAMAAPTPVSAYLHSATMVKAGVYLIARLAPPFADQPGWKPVVLTAGALTMLWGGYGALRQFDLKLLLAHSTISQLGFMILLLGVGSPETTFAGLTVVIAHAAFKAALFLVVGTIDHEVHTRDLRHLTGLGRRLPRLLAISVVAGASMAGIPPLFGFVAKEAAFESLLHLAGGWGAVLLTVAVGGSALTVAYTARFVWGGFANRSVAVAERPAEPHRPGWGLVGPPALLAGASLLVGLWPALADPTVVTATTDVGRAAGVHLKLWHGFTVALALSVAAVAAGIVLFVVEGRRIRSQLADAAARRFETSLAWLTHFAEQTTSVVQNGSLPIYLGLILATLFAGPGLALALNPPGLGNLEVAQSAPQLALAVLVAAAAVGVAVSRHRFVAVIFLGATGYGVAGLFMLEGAPDLALTQLGVETLAVVAFVLVLRHLPAQFSTPQWRLGRHPRLFIAAGVGSLMAIFALMAGAARTAEPFWPEFVPLAVDEAGGSNIVNVILVDFRAIDTMGEITVLTVATLGMASLVRGRRRQQSDLEEEDAEIR